MVKIKNNINNKYNAFSLAEAILSMMIIVVVALSAIPVLTRVKHSKDVATSSVRGQMACIVEGGSIKQYLLNDSSGATPTTVSDHCTLTVTKRPEKYYILIAGSRQNGYDPQVKTIYSPSISNTLEIYPGLNGEDSYVTATTDSGTTTEVARAMGSGNRYNRTTQNLNDLNVKSCRVLNAPSNCDVTPSATPCSIVPADAEKNNYAARIECYQNASGSSEETAESAAVVEINGKNYTYLPQMLNLNSLTPNNSQTQSLTRQTAVYDANGFTIGLEFKDSSFMPAQKIGGGANPHQANLLKIISNISTKRATSVLAKIREEYAGSKDSTGGLVYIIW